MRRVTNNDDALETRAARYTSLGGTPSQRIARFVREILYFPNAVLYIARHVDVRGGGGEADRSRLIPKVP